MIAAVKLLHIAALVIWCAGLIALPLLLSGHKYLKRAAYKERSYRQFRLTTHILYTAIATPAAIIAIVAGTGLIFMAEIYEPWLLAKLALVSLMVMLHAFCGHMVQLSGEKPVTWRMPPVSLTLLLSVPAMAGVLWLVLAKPDLRHLPELLPAWMVEPLGKEAPSLFQEPLP